MGADADRDALEGDDLATWAALATVLEWLPPALDAPLFRDFGITHFEFGILFALVDAPDRTLRMSVLAGYANSSLSRLSRAVGRLEQRGLAKRTPDPGDGRYTLASLTAEGVRVFDEASPRHAATVRRLVLDALTQAQRRQLRAIAGRIVRATGAGTEWTPRTPEEPS